MAIFCLSLLAAAAFVAGCSSSPKNTGEVYTLRNRAADFAQTGDKLFYQSEYEKALDLYFQAFDLHASLDNLPGIIKTSISIGRLYLAAGETKGAEEYLSAAFKRAIELDDSELIFLSANGIAEFYLSTDRTDEAGSYLDRALSLAGKGTPARELALLYHNLGVYYKRTGRPADSENAFLTAAKINEKEKIHSQLAANRYMLAVLALQRSDLPAALDWLNKALSSDKAAENSRGIASDLSAIASIYQQQGDHEKALDHYVRAFTVFRYLGMIEESKRTLKQMISEAETLGKEDETEQYRAILKSLEARG